MNALRAIASTLCAVLALSALVACRREREPRAVTSPAPRHVVTRALVARTLPPRVDDAQLVLRVKAALATQVGIDAFRIKVRARRGTVTLEGHASDDALARSELETAREIPGVERVVNRIRIGP